MKKIGLNFPCGCTYAILKKGLIVMKITLFLILISTLNLLAIGTYSQNTRITLKLNQTPLKQALKEIERSSEFYFLYNNELVDVERKVDIQAENEQINTILDHLFANQAVKYAVFDRQIVISPSTMSPAQQPGKKVSGKVSDTSGATLPGVSVVVKGTTIGVITDLDGNYALSGIPENATLLFSFVGMKSQAIAVANNNQINVVLDQETIGLDEVVAIGYGTMKKSDLTGAVASISTEQLNSVKASNVLSQVQGKLAGVDVVSSDGTPGSTPTIRIRGNRSITANNDPLYVVDGIPTTQGISDFNPGDIESMEVLKDASAVAIYGSRGANGVILITTKRGKKGAAQISYNTYYGAKEQIADFNKMNAQQFVEFRRVAYGYTKSDNTHDQVILGRLYTNFQNGVETDYLKEIYRQGMQTEHQISAGGGDEKLNYYLSGNYYKEEGVLKLTDYERFSLRVNLDARLTEKIKVGLSLTASKDLRNRMDSNDPTINALRYVPISAAYDANGKLVAYPNPDESLQSSPLTNLAPNQYKDETKGFRLFSNLFGEYAITKDLKYRLNFGTDVQYSRRGTSTGDFTGSSPIGAITNTNIFSYTVENILSYDKIIGKHNFNLVGLYSAQFNSTETSSLSAQGIPIVSSNFYALGTSEKITGIGSGLTDWGLLSYMGRINYKYKDRYLITASARTDGSSRLAKGNKWAFFPAASAAWILTEEDFMKNMKLSFLKIRAGFGSVGNTAITPYQTQGGLTRSAYAFGDNSAYGYQQFGIPNADLSWEISNTINMGIDFGLFKNRISGNLEYYNTKTKDLLLQRLLPTTSGYNSVVENVGSTRNHGWEFKLSANILNRANGLKWDVDLNLSKNKEEILELFNGKMDDVGNKWFIGRPINSFYDYVSNGIWQTSEAAEAAKIGQAPGQIKIKDVNGRDSKGVLTNLPDGQINTDDRAILGSTNPDWTGGITNRMTYKGFDLSLSVYTRQGQMLNSTYHDLSGNYWEGRYANQNLDYWTPLNPTNAYPMPIQGKGILYYSALQYFDGSFVKLQNFTLGYDFSKNLVKTKSISSFRIYVSATNPKTWSTYKTVDPETGRALSSATYLIGLNLKF